MNVTMKGPGITVNYNSEKGLLDELYSDLSNQRNLLDCRNGFGGVRYTLQDDDITTDEPFLLYQDRRANYNEYRSEGSQLECDNTDLDIHTVFSMENGSFCIHSCSGNKKMSQFGLDLNFNFLGKKNGTYLGQILPTSPYTSEDNKTLYYIMPVVGVGFCTVVSRTPGCFWRLIYSPYCSGHYITGMEILSSTDKLFGHEGKKDLSLEIFFAKTLNECYEKIRDILHCPLIMAEEFGTFRDELEVTVSGNADTILVRLNDKTESVPVKGGKAVVHKLGYGRHTLIPYSSGEAGPDAQVWFGMEPQNLFEKSCDSISAPYHGDPNLCEGWVWCWSMLSYMNLYKNKKYIETVTEAVKTIMGETGKPETSQTIVPYAVDGYPPYHIYHSERVQEQFFGISILTEMYKLTGEKKYLDFAVSAAETVIKKYQREDGAIFTRNTDYTTVCSPVIPIIDLALLIRDSDREYYEFFAQSAGKLAQHLLERGFHFPTEGGVTDETDEEMEDGSISCTALSLLYYCRYVERKQEYIDFARQVLELHDNWISYTPDVRLYRSSMRWWENIWEGDGTGPAICGGHAWTIWRAEADYHLAVLTNDEEYFRKSLNGFMTNFSKIREDGETYACYQPDFFTGGGSVKTRTNDARLSEEDYPKQCKMTHDYPKHFDHSLSRYAWVRACATWLKDGRFKAVKEK